MSRFTSWSPALDLDAGLEPHGQVLDLLVDGTALDPHLALNDAAGHHVRLGRDRLDVPTARSQAREQLLEAHVHS